MRLNNAQTYESIRDLCRTADHQAREHASRLRQRAEAFCREPAPAVTDKQFTPHSPSQNPHDYVSIGTYWWPDPEAVNGLPYTQRDGQLSPDFQLYDRPRWDRAADGIITCAKAAYFLDQPEFALAAVRRLRRWFCDPQTCMTPHLCYAQMIPGRCTGRATGVIDFALYLPAVLDHVELLGRVEGTPWTDEDRRTLARWCSTFLAWLVNHPFGHQEEECGNNHAVYYDRLVACLALFCRDLERARTQLARSRQRIHQQIEPDGSMPAELRRTCSFGYTVMNLRGFVDLAWLGQQLAVPLWSHRGEDGHRSIPAAVDWLYGCACSRLAWPYPQIEAIDWRMIRPVLENANALSGQTYELDRLAHRMPKGFVPRLFAMLEPIHPFGETRSPLS